MARQRLIQFRWTKDTLSVAFRKLPENVRRAVNEVVDKTIDRVFAIVKFSTPVDTGAALAAWEIERDGAGAGRVVNRTAYINVLEFGGYPVRPARGAMPPGSFQRGNAFLGGLPPGPRTMVSPAGEPPMTSNVSKQAPHGMVRKALGEVEEQFEFDLEEAVERAWGSG